MNSQDTWLDRACSALELRLMLSESIATSAIEDRKLACPKCGDTMRRLARKGLLQKGVLPLFGYYPWECLGCRTKRLVRARGEHRFHRIWDDSDLESFEPADNPTNQDSLDVASTFARDSSPETAHSPAVPPGDA